MHGNSRHGSSPSSPRASADAERISDLLEPAVTAMGMDLEGVRITPAGRRRLLRVVVDCDGGVSLDAIALVSRELSARLDAVPAMGDAPYTLEVSSPGTDRPLTEPRHWRRAAGRLVVASLTAQPRDETGSGGTPATIEGRITGADDHGVMIDVDGQNRRFGYADLGPGRILLEFARLPGLPGKDEDAGPGQGADEEDPDGY